MAVRDEVTGGRPRWLIVNAGRGGQLFHVHPVAIDREDVVNALLRTGVHLFAGFAAPPTNDGDVQL